MDLYSFNSSDKTSEAKIKIDSSIKSKHPISPYLTGKFCEHLFSNIYRGMHAQILQNPTFGDWPFADGTKPDGGIKRTADEEQIAHQIRLGAEREGYPDAELLVQSREDCLAHWWIREGERENILFSSDVGQYGGRAQRVELFGPGMGIAQWTYLPLHRIRKYEWTLVFRSPDITEMRIALYDSTGSKPVCKAEVKGISNEWKVITGIITVPEGTDDNGVFRFVLSSESEGQFVVSHIFLNPADHVFGSDPDVIRMLRESKLSLLRWPGGNFVSGYHWENGIGPWEQRPTVDNPAWPNLEYHLFGTDEFVQFCCEVKCEPMICLNAGDGTPEEAAAWVEYCNGPADSEYGAKRAKNGHSEPYNIKFWEVGNEIYGKWQTGWSTPGGYSDRYRRYATAMKKADPFITLIANGAPAYFSGPGAEAEVWTEHKRYNWNRRLCKENADIMQWLSDHSLEGYQFPASTEPMHVYSEYMMMPDMFEQAHKKTREIMKDLGIKDPRLALTELQIFGEAKQPEDGEEIRLTRENIVSPETQAEALHLTFFHHAAVRLHPFFSMITHTATLNHGGGLRKVREQVFRNPVFLARTMLADLSETIPCAVDVTCGEENSPGVYRARSTDEKMFIVSAVAGETADKNLVVSIAHRGSKGPVSLRLEVPEEYKGADAEIVRLFADNPWDRNTFDEPEKITPEESSAKVKEGVLEIELPLFSVTKIVLKT